MAVEPLAMVLSWSGWRHFEGQAQRLDSERFRSAQGPGGSLRDTLKASRTRCVIPWHGTHEATRLHHAPRQRGRVAARRAGAAASDAGYLGPGSSEFV